MPNVDIGTVSGKLTIQDQFTSTLKRANSELRSFREQSDRDFGAIRDSASKIGLGMIAGAGAVTALGGSLVKAAASAEQTQIAFTTLLGSTEAATAKLNELRDFAAKTPFEFNDLTRATTKMVALGFASKDVIPTLTAVGDAAAGLGMGAEGVDRIITALGQMRAKTKVSAEEMMQLTEAGIPAWSILAQSIGKSTAETMDLASKGVIPADKAIQALLTGMSGKFGGLMAAQAETAAGKFSNLKDAVDKLKVDLGRELLPVAKEAVGRLQGIVDTLNDMPQATKKNVVGWSTWAAAVAGSGGALAIVAGKLGELISKARLLGIPLGAGGLAFGAAAVASAIMKHGREEMEADVAARRKAQNNIHPSAANPQPLAPGRDGRPVSTPRWRVGQPLPSGFRELAAASATAAGIPGVVGVQGSAYRRAATGGGGGGGGRSGGGGGGGGGRSGGSGGGGASGPSALERELQRLEDAYEFARLSGNEAQTRAARAALMGFLQRHSGRSGFGLAALRRLAQVKREAQEEQLARGRVTQDAERELQERLRANMQEDAAQARAEFDLEEERRRDAARRWQAAGGSEAWGAIWGSVTSGVRGGLSAIRGLGQVSEPVFRNPWPAYYARQQARGDALMGLGSGALGVAGALGGVASILGNAAGAVGKTLKQEMGEAIEWARRRYREWQRDAEEGWARVGEGMFLLSRRPGGGGEFLRQAGVSAQSAQFSRLWDSLQNTGFGRWVQRNQGEIGKWAGVASSIYSISQGEGGWFGGAVSGMTAGSTIASALGIAGPWGAIAGAIAGAIFGADAEDERRHRQAMLQRDATNRALQRMDMHLAPVMDIFRSMGMNLLPSSMTYGGGTLAAQAAYGARV